MDADLSGTRDPHALPRERHLAVVAMVDIVGYSGLVEADEDGTLERWRTLRSTVLDPILARYRGRVFKSLGDGLLIEFASAHDAVQCAVEIQELVRLSAVKTDPASLVLRWGIHLGDVVADEDDLLGDGINVVARLQEAAAPGGVVVSAAVYEQVRDLGLAFDDLGELALRSISRPIRAYGLLGDRRLARVGAAGPGKGRPSIAVLPFHEYGAEAERSYFGDGIVEDMIGALASLPDLFVVSRNSTLRFSSDPIDLRGVRRDLGVRYALSGSIGRARDRIRISAELCDTESLAVLWTDRVDGRADELFDLQDRLSAHIVTTLAPHVREAEIRRALRKRPESLDAYDFLLRGLDRLYRLRRDEFEQAREMFQRAIALDPQYAAPYAFSALWHTIRIGQGWSTEPGADLTAVAELAAAALERDRFDTAALALCGHARAILFRDFEGAFALFDQAISASPNSALAWTRSSPAFSYVGNGAEGRRRSEMGLALSPLDPHLFYSHATLTLACYTSGDYEEAIVWGRRCMAENPAFTANLRLLAASLVAAGRPAEAREIAEALLRLDPGFRAREFSARYAYRDAERRDLLARHLGQAGLPE